jgi:transcriptional regulator of acetoin/glycerol metabolism
MSEAARHITEIERAVLGGQTARDAVVVESWRRCVDAHGLDPARPQAAYIVPEHQLREHREQSERLIAIARSGTETLFRQVAGQNYVLLLADAQGVTVDFFGDPAFESDLRAAGLYLGAEWTEQRAGTCGVGACIETGQALTIHQTDHFDVTHTPLSCTAAPIYATDGRLTAVLDISLLRSPTPKASQRLAQHLVGASARRIELANLMAGMRREWVLRLSRSPEFLDVDPEAAVSLDGAGRIIGMTHGAARMLAQTVGADWRAPGAVLGRPIADFFEMDADDLPGLTRSRPAEERVARLRDGSALFAHAIEPAPLRARPAPAADIPAPLRALSGEDPAMRALQARAAKLAPSALPILLRGETGSGKERLARAIHAARPGRGPFVAVNCAAIPESLIEGELFGHAPGAFTGALARGRRGLIEEADGGVLFLDEIGDMPLMLQSRLLRVLSEGEVTPVGALHPRRVRLKAVSASHRDLAALVAEGRFREDLFYRLAGAVLTLPPLRERLDFDWLLDALLRAAGAVGIAPEARARLSARDWPGNIRELDNAVQAATAMAAGTTIDVEHLPEPAIAPRAAAAPDLRAALQAAGWNVTRAARALGVDRTTVHRRMRREGLAPPR